MRFNARFAVPAADADRAWRPAPQKPERELLLCLQHERKASHGSSISFAGTLYQLLDHRGKVVLLTPKARVTVLEKATGTLQALYSGTCYRLSPFEASGASGHAPNAGSVAGSVAGSAKPATNHPWRRYGRRLSVPATISEARDSA